MGLHGASRDVEYARAAPFFRGPYNKDGTVVTICWGLYPGPISSADCLSNTIRPKGAETVRSRGNRRRSLGTVGFGHGICVGDGAIPDSQAGPIASTEVTRNRCSRLSLTLTHGNPS